MDDEDVLVALGDIKTPSALIALTGVIITGALLSLRIKGALLIGIFVATIAGIPFGITEFPGSSILTLPPGFDP